MADIYGRLSDLEHFFKRDEEMLPEQAQIALREMNAVVNRMADGVSTRKQNSREPHTYREAFDALHVLARLTVALTREDSREGLAACQQMRELGQKSGWPGF